jgi:cbb3-type cytochrome oxidase maturation protein
MDILFVLIPLSVALALAILAALGWAVWRGQFDALEAEGERILQSD